MDWLTVAERLAVGKSKRVNCECGDGHSASISRLPLGYSYFCFRCSKKEFIRGHLEIKDLKPIEEEIVCIELPKSVALPDIARIYLWKIGIGTYLIEKYGITWSIKMERLILPCEVNQELVAYIGRDVSGRRKIKAVNSIDRNSPYHMSKNSLGDIVCLVEDYFSCIKVGEVIPCISLNGTKLSSVEELKGYKTVVIWLDPDKAGRNGAIKIKKQLQSQFVIVIINSKRDPKYHSIKEVRDAISAKVACS